MVILLTQVVRTLTKGDLYIVLRNMLTQAIQLQQIVIIRGSKLLVVILELALLKRR